MTEQHTKLVEQVGNDIEKMVEDKLRIDTRDYLYRPNSDEIKELISLIQGSQQIPDILFSGVEVYEGLHQKAKRRTSPENVSDVLDSVVRILRANPPETKP